MVIAETVHQERPHDGEPHHPDERLRRRANSQNATLSAIVPAVQPIPQNGTGCHLISRV